MFKKVKYPIGLFFVTFIIYYFSHHTHLDDFFNYYVLLANGFLNGHLYVSSHPSWLNELVFWNNHYYVIYPPMPAILLIPEVLLFGANFSQPLLSMCLGATNVGLSYLVFKKLFQKNNLALWMAILNGFGTIQFYQAEVGSAWYLAHIVALLFIWLSLLEVFTRQRLWLIGLLIGGAYLARLPTILVIIFPLLFLQEKFISLDTKHPKVYVKPLLSLGIGVLIAVLINWLYNYLRFGTISDFAYTIYLNSQSPEIIQNWFRHGFFSVYYLPERLKDIFLSLPVFISSPPFVIPSMYVMAIWFTTPALFLILCASFKKRLVWTSLLTALVVAIPSLIKGGNGFSQFGYRYSLDFLPFLLIMVASGFNNRNNFFTKALLVLSILINIWGIIMIEFLNLWRI